MITEIETDDAALIDEDAAIVAAARGGNTSSFEALARRYEARICK